MRPGSIDMQAIKLNTYPLKIQALIIMAWVQIPPNIPPKRRALRENKTPPTATGKKEKRPARSRPVAGTLGGPYEYRYPAVIFN